MHGSSPIAALITEPRTKPQRHRRRVGLAVEASQAEDRPRWRPQPRRVWPRLVRSNRSHRRTAEEAAGPGAGCWQPLPHRERATAGGRVALRQGWPAGGGRRRTGFQGWKCVRVARRTSLWADGWALLFAGSYRVPSGWWQRWQDMGRIAPWPTAA